MRRLLLAAACLPWIAACATRPPVPDVAAPDATFVLEEDLAGRTVGRGRFTSITGTDRGFTAYLDGRQDGETFVLKEDFVYDDGETDTKTWRFRKVAGGEYEGVREDVVGTARGFADGDVFRLEYLVDVPTGAGGSRRVRFRDVLAERSDGAIVNTATVAWYGLRVGRVELVITPAPGP